MNKDNETIDTLKVHSAPKIVVIGGGSGQPIILKGLKKCHVDLTAIVTVADDGGSSGALRNYLNMVPPGDVRNVLSVLANVDEEIIDVFQYRFNSDDDMLAGHALGNLILASIAEQDNSIFSAVNRLSKFFKVQGNVFPVADEPLILHAEFTDGTVLDGESAITAAGKKIKHVWVTPQFTLDEHRLPEAPSEVVNAILNADIVVLGPGSLFTSIMPNLMVPNVAEALLATRAKVVYVANIMTQKGETDGYSDADHVRAINEHVGERVVDAVIMNTAPVPDDYIDWKKWNEVSKQVISDPEHVRSAGAVPVVGNLLELRDDGAFHDGDKVAQLIMKIAEAKNID
ncbi:gluconeogenesis factor YvcK family protein [Weissella muntiaci]|uniref:gluconeogenesis factor YvcK family protein n=1 Tax=Weissella muntiaci TaxID=2508881 RepID=UPI001651F428|nr:uridine diphosphate-N-acetylglucosamine-binding protein YvcK [Weissella muntiaci]